MGVPAKEIALAKNDGVSAYGTITTFAESPKSLGLLYTGADDGTVSVSRDDGKNWTNIDRAVSGASEKHYVSRIAASAFDEGVVYATFDGHRDDDYAPYVYASERLRRRAGDRLLAICRRSRPSAASPKTRRTQTSSYLGTEFGLFVTLDRGQHWIRMRGGLPTVPVAEITIQPRDNDMLVATHGRSIWILDDLTPIQHAAAVMNREAALFDVRPSMSFFDDPEDRSRWMGDRPFWGNNPPSGAAVSYYLKDKATAVRLVVRDEKGSPIADIDAGPMGSAAGINRVTGTSGIRPSHCPRFPVSQ